MAFEDRSYSGNAVTTTLTANISAVATTIAIASSTGWPDGTSGPFFAGIAPANDPKNFTEVVRLTSRTGLTLNVQTVPVGGRGWDGTTASSHIVGEVISHVATATDFDEANQHIANTALDHHGQYLTVARHDQSARHGFGILPTAGTPSTSAVGDTATSGSSNNLARIDHRHAREGFGSPVTSGPVSADGVATSVSRSDHKHAGGIPIIADASARNPSPVTGEVQLEADTKRAVMWTGSRWQRGPGFSGTSRTGAYVSRVAVYSIPDGGASSYILPWDTVSLDTDGYIPPPDGTTTYTLTCPSLETAGMYIVTGHLVWASYFTQRNYVEIVHGFSGSFNQHRVPLTGEDRGTISVSLDIANGDTIQMGLWQNSGSVQDASGYLTMYRLFG